MCAHFIVTFNLKERDIEQHLLNSLKNLNQNTFFLQIQ